MAPLVTPPNPPAVTAPTPDFASRSALDLHPPETIPAQFWSQAAPASAIPTPAILTPAIPTPASPTPAIPTPAIPTPAILTPASPTPARPSIPIPAPLEPESTIPNVPIPGEQVPSSPQAPPAQPKEPLKPPASPGTPSPGTPSPGTPSPARPSPSTPQPLPVPIPGIPGSPSPIPTAGPSTIEVKADQQEFDQLRQIFTAEGKVLMIYRDAILDADKVQVNLFNRYAVAEGNVAFTRGAQVLRGDRLEFNLGQGTGRTLGAKGEVFLPTAGKDLTAPTQDGGIILGPPVSDRVRRAQPLQNVTTTGGVSVSVGAGRDVGRVPGATENSGNIRRLRFEAVQLDFQPGGWQAEQVRLTNDPFSPPELVVKADRAVLTQESPTRSVLVAQKPRLVFDNRFSLPLPGKLVFDQAERAAPLFTFGIDSGDRGGVFIQRAFDLVANPRWSLRVTPQYFVQKALTDGGNPIDPQNFGLKAKLRGSISPRTQLLGNLTLTSLDLGEVENELRGNLQVNQLIGTHNLNLGYTYRDRILNGSLGFRTVQSSLGLVLSSPTIPLGPGLSLSYLGGIQNIVAETDRLDLLEPIRRNNRINLTRYQAQAALNGSVNLWVGKPLPATATEGLRYSPVPVVPYVALGGRLEGVVSGYTSGDSQEDVIGTVSISGQLGHFAKKAFDYTAFSFAYTQNFGGSGSSPFLFDRTVDNRILSAQVIQQVVGPLRVGFQTTFNLDNSDAISTDYIVEYHRRTYGITLRYNPVLSIGSIGLRLSDFNWGGSSEPFDGSVTSVEGGVKRGE
jgi:hypothetical protein